jgi:hypothetical protein
VAAEQETTGGQRRGTRMIRDGKPCRKCGSTERYANGNCAECQRRWSREALANPAYRERIREQARARRADPVHRESENEQRRAKYALQHPPHPRSPKYPDQPPGMTKLEARRWQAKKRREAAKVTPRSQRTDPCARCGSTERYANGRCVPCYRARQRRIWIARGELSVTSTSEK